MKIFRDRMLTLSEETGIDRNADGRGTCRALRRRPGQGFSHAAGMPAHNKNRA